MENVLRKHFVARGYLSISNFSSSIGLQKDLYVVKKILTKAGSATNERHSTFVSTYLHTQSNQHECHVVGAQATVPSDWILVLE